MNPALGSGRERDDVRMLPQRVPVHLGGRGVRVAASGSRVRSSTSVLLV